MELKLKNDANVFITKITEMFNTGKYESYMEVVVSYCEKNNIEIETAASLLKGATKIKSKLQEEGENINLLPKTNKVI